MLTMNQLANNYKTGAQNISIYTYYEMYITLIYTEVYSLNN